MTSPSHKALQMYLQARAKRSAAVSPLYQSRKWSARKQRAVLRRAYKQFILDLMDLYKELLNDDN